MSDPIKAGLMKPPPPPSFTQEDVQAMRREVDLELQRKTDRADWVDVDVSTLDLPDPT